MLETLDRPPPAPPSRQPVHAPTAAQIRATQLTAFMNHVAHRAGRSFGDYRAFEQFCLDHSQDFWEMFLDWSQIEFEGSVRPVRVGDAVETAAFFPNVRLNYAENLLRVGEGAFAPARPAITAVHGDRPTERWTRGELRDRAMRLSAALLQLGLAPRDRVAIVAHNTPWAIAAGLGAAGIGCTVSTGALDVGSFALISRFGQVEPFVLMADLPDPASAIGAQQRERFLEVVRGLPSLKHVVLLDDYPAPNGIGVAVSRASELPEIHAGAALGWPRLPFNHPLFILFTSGTTGAPKCLVHGAGGTLIEHVKEHRLHGDLRASDKLYFQTSTGWMMWNWQLSALAVGAEIVLFDGAITAPDRLWRIVADERVTVFGTSPAYLQLCERSGWRPGPDFDFAALRAILSTGSILYPRQQDWVSENVKRLAIQSISGGTDIVGCFVLGNPNLPAYSAECQSRSLGLDVRALGAETRGGVGDLVCANPFPSRPLGLLDDLRGSRFHQAYFSQNEGMWTHGDLIEFTAEGSARMHGRSDGVLNIRGIRIGPAEIYRILEDVPEITEAMAVEQQVPDEPGGARLVLLVVLKQGQSLSDALVSTIKRQLGSRGSAAHVPAVVLAVDQLPTTFSGKRSERSARDALSGQPVINAGALRNPESLDALKQWASGSADPQACNPETDPQLRSVVRQVWQQALGLVSIGPDENYFDLGGDSLRAAQIMAQIAARIGRALPTALLFQFPTIATLAKAIGTGSSAAYEPLVKLADGAHGPPLFIVHGVGGSVMELRPLALALRADRPVYGIQARGFRPEQQPHRCVQDMAREYLAAVRSVQPRGPYLLVGYSFGGWVAHEMAHALLAAGEKVALLGILDTTSSELHWTASAWLEYVWRRLRCGLRQAAPLGWRERLRQFLVLAQSFAARLLLAWRSQPPEAEPEALPEEFRRVRDAGLAAAATHVPMAAAVPVTLFRSDLALSHLCDPRLVWQDLAPRVEVLDVPGNHITMIRPPHLAVLADRLSRCVQSHAPLLDREGMLFEAPAAAAESEGPARAGSLAAQGV